MDSNLQIIDFPFSSPVADLIVALNNLRDKQIWGSTPPYMFFQMKNIFQTLESIESARIEGNKTTLAEYVTAKSGGITGKKEQWLEIANIEKATEFIEEHFSKNQEAAINQDLICQIHKLIVLGLDPKRDGDEHPGEYRQKEVRISKSNHIPPKYEFVSYHMEDLFTFINYNHESKYDLYKTAVAHHRFVWIHPFGNGNGRTVRLLTYAMLIKQGFNVAVGQILNPTAIFCNDRDKYYAMLACADDGSDSEMLKWCEYVLSGLKTEISKIDKLLQYDYLKNEILIPALKKCYEIKRIINEEQYKWLLLTIQKGESVKAADFKKITPTDDPKYISRKINKLKEMKLLENETDASRQYYLSLTNKDYFISIVEQLTDKGFVPESVNAWLN